MSYPHSYPQLSAHLSTVLYDLSTSILIPFKHKYHKCIPLKHNTTNQPIYNQCIYHKLTYSNTNQANIYQVYAIQAIISY